MLRRPSFGFAEIAWRWSFGAACLLLLLFSWLEYLDTLPVTRLDLLLLRSRQPALISQAISHIFHGSGLRVVETFIVLSATLAIGWILLASFARAATVKSALAYFQTLPEIESRETEPSRFRSLLGLNFLRVAAALAATIGCVAAFVLAGLVSSPKNPAPGSAFLLFASILMLVGIAWSFTNWFLSLASVFSVARGQTTFSSISSSVSLIRNRPGSVFAAGTWFGLAHLTAFVVATSVVAFPLGFIGFLPGSMVFGGVLLVTLLYFAVADFLYIGRLAAYVGILELPYHPPEPVIAIPPVPPPIPSSAVDPTELILSDVPAPI